MLVDNILLCNIYSPTKWKSIYCVYFKKHIKAVLIDRTNQLLGDGFIHKALGSQRNTCWSPFGDFCSGWKSMQQPTLSYQWDWWMSLVLSGTFGSDGLQSRGQPLLLLSCHLDKPAHWSSCRESHNLWAAEHEGWDSSVGRVLRLPERKEKDFILTGLSGQNKRGCMESSFFCLSEKAMSFLTYLLQRHLLMVWLPVFHPSSMTS